MTRSELISDLAEGLAAPLHVYAGAAAGSVAGAASNRGRKKYYKFRQKHAKPGKKKPWQEKARKTDKTLGRDVLIGYGAGAAAGTASGATKVAKDIEGPDFSWKKTGRKMGGRVRGYAKRNVQNAKDASRERSNRRVERRVHRRQKAAGVTKISRTRAKRYDKDILNPHSGLLRATNEEFMTRDELIEAIVEAYTSTVRHFSVGEQRRAVKKAQKNKGRVVAVTPKREVHIRWPEHKGREAEVSAAISQHLTREGNRPSLSSRQVDFSVENDPKGKEWERYTKAHGLDPKKGGKLVLKRRWFAKRRKLKEPMRVAKYK